MFQTFNILLFIEQIFIKGILCQHCSKHWVLYISEKKPGSQFKGLTGEQKKQTLAYKCRGNTVKGMTPNIQLNCTILTDALHSSYNIINCCPWHLKVRVVGDAFLLSLSLVLHAYQENQLIFSIMFMLIELSINLILLLVF